MGKRRDHHPAFADFGGQAPTPRPAPLQRPQRLPAPARGLAGTRARQHRPRVGSGPARVARRSGAPASGRVRARPRSPPTSKRAVQPSCPQIGGRRLRQTLLPGGPGPQADDLLGSVTPHAQRERDPLCVRRCRGQPDQRPRPAGQVQRPHGPERHPGRGRGDRCPGGLLCRGTRDRLRHASLGRALTQGRADDLLQRVRQGLRADGAPVARPSLPQNPQVLGLPRDSRPLVPAPTMLLVPHLAIAGVPELTDRFRASVGLSQGLGTSALVGNPRGIVRTDAP